MLTLNNVLESAGIIVINIEINIPISITVTNESLFIINPSIKIVESFASIAAFNADAPSQLPKTAFKNIIANVTNTPVIAIPSVPDTTSFIIWRIFLPPLGKIAHPENSHDSNISGSIIKSIDNFMNISKKYNGTGNSAKKKSTIIVNPPKNTGTFGNIGIPHIILCIYSSLNDIFSIVHPTVSPNAVIW